MLHKGSITFLFGYIFGERHCYLFVSFLRSKNVIGALFIDCLLLNTLFRMFCVILRLQICQPHVSCFSLASNRSHTVCLLV